MDKRWGKDPVFMSAFGMLHRSQAEAFGLLEVFDAALAEMAERGYFERFALVKEHLCPTCGQPDEEPINETLVLQGPKTEALDEAIGNLWKEGRFP